MYHMDMYLTVQTLHKRGVSQQQTANELGISRHTVRKILQQLEQGITQPPPQVRTKKLDENIEQVKALHQSGLTARLIYQRLCQQQPPVQTSYRSVVRLVKAWKGKEVYVPLHSDAGAEGQVDFGYLGTFEHEGKPRKVWVFAMVLSHSRYAYFRAVLDQRVLTFIDCHRHAFEFFTGVPASVKIDNLKAGVVRPDFYDPLIQQQYANFLTHYQCQPITARVRRPQDKGKVESAIKYVKNSFLKGLSVKTFVQLQTQLLSWTLNTCNQRLHGTTRRIPAVVFAQTEQRALKALPNSPWQTMSVEARKVNQMGHVLFRYSYYSVPAQYVGQTLRLESSGGLLRIFAQDQSVAVHQLTDQQGVYVSRSEHAPDYKPRRSPSYYRQQVALLGPQATAFLAKVEQDPTRNWTHVGKGLLHLSKVHSAPVVELACERALRYGSLSFASLRKICEQELYKTPEISPVIGSGLGGYQHELSLYDQLTNRP